MLENFLDITILPIEILMIFEKITKNTLVLMEQKISAPIYLIGQICAGLPLSETQIPIQHH